MEARLARQMTQHIEDTAALHGVTVYWGARGFRDAEAFPGGQAPMVVLPKIRRPADYLVGLHEMGHCVDDNALRFTNSPDAYGTLLCESAAWAWAMEQVPKVFVRHIRAKDWDEVAYGWRTYLADGTGWNRPRKVPYPDELLPRGSVQPRETLGPLRDRPL